MSPTIVNGVALLVTILVPTLVASQSVLPSASSSPSARQYFTRQVDYDDVSYTDDETSSCVQYCRSQSSGTYHCCSPPVVPSGGGITDCSTQTVGCTGFSTGNQISCTPQNVDCEGRQRRPVATQPKISYRPPKVTRICGVSPCNPGISTVVHEVPVIHQGSVIHQDPVVYNSVIQRRPVIQQDPVVYRPVIQRRPVIHQDPVAYGPVIQQDPVVYRPVIQRGPVIHQDPVVYGPVIHPGPAYNSPNYVCKNRICNPVQPRRPTSCPGPRCRQPPQLPYTPPSIECKSPDLVEAVNQLVLRSYARAYAKQTFIDGIETIIGSHLKFSWYGQCVAPGKVQSIEDSDNVDVFDDDRDITTADCQPCTTRPTGARWCSTQLQTVLGTCDNCCHRSFTRTRRQAPKERQDLREAVANLLQRARTMKRHEFIAYLKEILKNDRQGLYSWNQMVLMQEHRIQQHSWTPTDGEEDVATVRPVAKPDAEDDESDSDSDGDAYEDS